jgi:hypothetical protein
LVIGEDSVKTILFFLILIGCKSNFDNKQDANNPVYWQNQFLYSGLFSFSYNGSGGTGPTVPVELPTVLKYDPSDIGFTTNQIATQTSSTVEFKSTSFIKSATASPAFPAGIGFSFNGNSISCFSDCSSELKIKPTTPSTSQPFTKYSISVCNTTGGCLGTEINIRVVNVTGNVLWGQSNYATSTVTPRTASSLDTPNGIAIDSTGGLYVADTANSRVLYFPVNVQVATRVYGQINFTTVGGNNPSRSASSLSGPKYLAIDSNDGLYVSDMLNNRILYYPAGVTTATRVYGQGGSYTTNTLGAISDVGFDFITSSLSGSIALDPSNNLYVVDSSRHRVLFFPAANTTASRVYGQNGNFTTGVIDPSSNSLDNLRNPLSVFISQTGTVYIQENRSAVRILAYEANQTRASSQIFTTNFAEFINSPRGLFIDSTNGIYTMNDSGILYYKSMTATKPSFEIKLSFSGNQNAQSLSKISGFTLDSGGNILISDGVLHRSIINKYCKRK